MRRLPPHTSAFGLVVVAAVVLAAGAWIALRPSSAPPLRASISTTSVLAGSDTAGYARALAPRPFRFPADYGAHPDFRSEWWYFTGNLEDRSGRRFGYELTFFRSALRSDSVRSASGWATRQAYMAHFALTDAGARRFRAFDRFERGALGLAGARPVPFRVWLDDWQVQSAGQATFPLHMSAAQGDVAVDLQLQRGKPPVAEGDSGLSRKGPAPGDASYYYSLTRMPTDGLIHIGGDTFRVRGDSWMDREWSTSALGPDEVGWDWFALQLGDGRDLMLYRIRRRDGTISPYSAGTLVSRDGRPRHLSAADFDVAVVGYWTSPRTGIRYPSGWRVRVPSAALDLRLRPLLQDQELDLAFRYWEGAVAISDHAAASAGRGYVELTGYGTASRPPR